VAIVGAGGTGSHVAVQLAHLGVGRLVLVDPDIVELSNLSRLVGARASDVGRRKADVLAGVAAAIRPSIEVRSVAASVLEIDPSFLSDNDLIVCCTDGHGSRALLTEFCAQHLLTLIDMGVEVQGTKSGTRAGGGIRIVRPGESCLQCMGVLDAALVREEFMSDSDRSFEAKLGYLRSIAEPAPSVISLNGVVASLAVVEILHDLLGLFSTEASRLLYRSEARSLTTAQTPRQEGCYVCGKEGILGMGDGRPLPRRVGEVHA
jgi:molybdopterin/thiamine biosynthesis adenylyltransferase